MSDDRAEPYRVGRKNSRNIYRVNLDSADYLDDRHIGVMFTPVDARLFVDGLNSAYGHIARDVEES